MPMMDESEERHNASLIVLGLFLVAAVLAGTSAFSEEGSAESVQSLTTESATPTPVPATAVPTATDVPRPTPTPGPTSTPVPTPTPRPSPTPVPTPTPRPIDPTDGILTVGATGREYTSPVEAVAAAQDGETIEIDAGNYVLASTLNINKSLTIRGSGPETVLTSNAATTIIVDGTTGSLLNLTVESAFSQTGDSRAPVILVTDSDYNVANVEVRNGAGYGLWYRSSTGKISNSLFVDNEWSGLVIEGRSAASTTEMIVRNNTANRNGQGFVWTGDAAGRGDFNCAWNSDGDGFAIFDTASPTLTGNDSLNNGGWGFVWYDNTAGSETRNASRNNDEGDFGSSAESEVRFEQFAIGTPNTAEPCTPK